MSAPRTAAAFEAIERAPAYRVLAARISEAIVKGALRPGEALPTESALCTQFGVNRSTVREGIRLLEENGLLQRVNARRMVVSRPSRQALGEQAERALLLHQVSFHELWETAMLLEPATAELAAAHVAVDDLERLQDNLARTERAVAAGESLVELDLEFHARLADAVHNRVLALAREPMQRLFYPAFAVVFERVPQAGRRLLEAHGAILAALRAHDTAQAATWMRRHIRDFARGYEAAGLELARPVAAGVPALAPGAAEPPAARTPDLPVDQEAPHARRRSTPA